MLPKHLLAVVQAVAQERATPSVVVEAVAARMLPSIRLVPQADK